MCSLTLQETEYNCALTEYLKGRGGDKILENLRLNELMGEQIREKKHIPNLIWPKDLSLRCLQEGYECCKYIWYIWWGLSIYPANEGACRFAPRTKGLPIRPTDKGLADSPHGQRDLPIHPTDKWFANSPSKRGGY